jgi:hypothetical protein
LTKFFIPAAENAEQAESIYEAICKFNSLTVSEQRIEKISWNEDGQAIECIVGSPLPASYGVGHEPVMAILSTGTGYLLCSASRGGLWGKPVVISSEREPTATYFVEA